MLKKVTVSIKRPAKKEGGDRYESEDGFVIYIPQDISRPNNSSSPLPKIEITFKDPSAESEDAP